jgi:hypothetical protein
MQNEGISSRMYPENEFQHKFGNESNPMKYLKEKKVFKESPKNKDLVPHQALSHKHDFTTALSTKLVPFL